MSASDPAMRCPGNGGTCQHYKFRDSSGSDGCRTRCQRTGAALSVHKGSDLGPLVPVAAAFIFILAGVTWALA